jgi:hypothetical protein
MRWISRLIPVALAAVALSAGAGARQQESFDTARKNAKPADWIQLFDGKSLDGWVPKITGFDLGVNYNDTFRVANGLLTVSYDKYKTFDSHFGHLFYNRQKFSYYIVVAEYRFVGEQVPGGPTWALRNNGLMLHSQAPQTMGKDQDFPISIEAQLLGGAPTGERSTANVCTPGTEIFMKGVMVKNHCTNSTSATYRGEQWVRVEVEVSGAEHLTHKVEGRTVLEYDKPQIGGPNVANFDPAVKKDGEPLGEGYIAIQGESAPTEFRKIEVLNLSGCMNPKAANYKPYYTHRDDATCK